MSFFRKTLYSVVIGIICSGSAMAAFPERPIRWVVPNPAGGGADTNVRLIARTLEPLLGQTLVIENRPGAGTIVGADAVAKSASDGYTWLTGDIGTFATNPSLFKKLPYNPSKDFKYVSLTTRYPLIVAARKDFPANNMRELIEYVKKNPGKVNFGTAGFGFPHHLALELLMEKTGTDFVHVPFTGSLAALQNMLNGEIDVMFLDVASGMQFIQKGDVKSFGIATSKRFDATPDIPTLKEQGLDFEFDLWQGIAVPAGTSPQVVDQLSRAIKVAFSDPKLKEAMLQRGAEAVGSSPEEFSAYVEKERAHWARLIKDRGIELK